MDRREDSYQTRRSQVSPGTHFRQAAEQVSYVNTTAEHVDVVSFCTFGSFWVEHCRRYIPSPCILEPRLQNFMERYKGSVGKDDLTGKGIWSEAMQAVHDNVLQLVRKGCVSGARSCWLACLELAVAHVLSNTAYAGIHDLFVACCRSCWG